MSKMIEDTSLLKRKRDQMSTLSWLDRILIVALSTLALLIPFGGSAKAAEDPGNANPCAVPYTTSAPCAEQTQSPVQSNQPVKMGPGQVEEGDRHVRRLNVTYAEPMPTPRFGARHYFETNDGAAYRYVTGGSCERANLVPNRICHTVVWYAR